MSSIIKFELKDLRKLANDKNSCVIEKKVTQNIPLQPWCLGNLKESVKNLLDYKIGKFDKEFNGILLSYKNLRILQNVGAIRNDNSDIQFQIQADYFIFCPYVGATLRGIVYQKNITHLGVLVHRVFNVVIPRPTEEPGSEWIGTNIVEGQQVIFQIAALDLYGALPYIRGKIDERWFKNFEVNGEEEEIDAKNISPLNVSYVNFDKTKPMQKQIGDGPGTSTKKSLVNAQGINNSMNGQNGDDAELSMAPTKSRTKKETKLLDNETKHSEPKSRPSKKHKKDG
ncbi:unnamed protein product [Pieris macdunnoughi]|uniref:DNA-directed RNA polymerase I subunit RPA43 n=1 Tax=Pieris macdunnoughi TaxID=345717 RepID=A0A821WDZ4_9NEOP|nr:unnamed protein product [Pieris macdunnoughi]